MWLLAAALCTAALAACRAQRPAAPAGEAGALYAEQRERMSTLVEVRLWGLAPEEARAAAETAFGAFDEVERDLNEWRPESALAALNRAAGESASVPLPANLCGLLGRALAGARETGGLFDPTWAALRGVWRFGTGAPGTPPREEEVRRLCPLVDHAAVILLQGADGACSARLPRAGMAVGLGGIAKGYGVDRASARLRARGARDFVVQAGGDLYAGGQRGGRPWRVALRDPRGAPNDALAEVEVQDAAFSTSADSEHFFVAEGVRYHHLIDPRTCWPARASRSATVLAASAEQAEVLTKAAFVAGGEEGLRLVERAGALAVIVDAAGALHVSPGLRSRLVLFERTRR